MLLVFIWLTGKPSSYDGWLENNLLAALRAAYDTGRCDKPQPFVDFIVYLQQLDPESSTAYWKTQLSGPQPTSFPPPLSTTYRVQTDKKVSFRTRLSIDNDLKVLTSSFLRAAWAFTVSLYSDSTDVIFASTLSGRQAPVPRIEDVAGKLLAEPETVISCFLLKGSSRVLTIHRSYYHDGTCEDPDR